MHKKIINLIENEKTLTNDKDIRYSKQVFLYYSDLLPKSPYSVRKQENTDQKNSVFGNFWRSKYLLHIIAQFQNIFQGLLRIL